MRPALELTFASDGVHSVRVFLAKHEFHRAPRRGIRRTTAGVVLVDASSDIARVTHVERSVCALEHVHGEHDDDDDTLRLGVIARLAQGNSNRGDNGKGTYGLRLGLIARLAQAQACNERAPAGREQPFDSARSCASLRAIRLARRRGGNVRLPNPGRPAMSERPQGASRIGGGGSRTRVRKPILAGLYMHSRASNFARCVEVRPKPHQASPSLISSWSARAPFHDQPAK